MCEVSLIMQTCLVAGPLSLAAEWGGRWREGEERRGIALSPRPPQRQFAPFSRAGTTTLCYSLHETIY